jgi:hypothetical protein
LDLTYGNAIEFSGFQTLEVIFDCPFVSLEVSRTETQLSNKNFHQQQHGFNAEKPDVEVELLSPEWQYSFTKIIGDKADQIFAQMITPLGNGEYYDWSAIAF